MLTRIPYMYRDADNYKQFAHIYLEGELTDAHRAKIQEKLSDEVYFIPGDLKLGVEELQSRMTPFPSESDHVWHELELDSARTAMAVPAGANAIPVEKFVAAFDAIPGPNGWNVQGAIDRLGLEETEDD